LAHPDGRPGVNVCGSLVLGFLLILVMERFPSSRFVRPFFATGFLGAFTTFSTFTLETDLLVSDGHAGMAAT
jgi:CrcB protein